MTQTNALQTTAEASADWFRPTSIEEAMEVGEKIANSNIVPLHLKGKGGDVLVAMMLGAEVGLSPMAALRGVAVINGRPALWGDAMLGVCRAHPEFLDIEEVEVPDGSAAKCTVSRLGQSPIVKTFTVEDAKKAGLWNKKGPWQNYPKRMLQMRARGFALRDAFADALCGIITVEEARDIPPELPLDENGVPVHEVKRTRAEQTLDNVRAKQSEKAEAAEPDQAEVQTEQAPEDPPETRKNVLLDIVGLCNAAGIGNHEMLDEMQRILDRQLESNADMSVEDCIEVRRVLREEKT